MVIGFVSRYDFGQFQFFRKDTLCDRNIYNMRQGFNEAGISDLYDICRNCIPPRTPVFQILYNIENF